MVGPIMAAGSFPGCSSHLGHWCGPGGRNDSVLRRRWAGIIRRTLPETAVESGDDGRCVLSLLLFAVTWTGLLPHPSDAIWGPVISGTLLVGLLVDLLLEHTVLQPKPLRSTRERRPICACETSALEQIGAWRGLGRAAAAERKGCARV